MCSRRGDVYQSTGGTNWNLTVGLGLRDTDKPIIRLCTGPMLQHINAGWESGCVNLQRVEVQRDTAQNLVWLENGSIF